MTRIPFAGEFGTVQLRDWWLTPDATRVLALTGKLTLLQASDFGVTPAPKDEATWALAIEGDTEKVIVLGCQIRGAHMHAPDAETHGGDTYLVP